MIFSVICTSFIFAALHFIPFQTNITLSFIPLFCFSFYLTAVYIRCENIWVPVFFHGINNLYVYFPNIFISAVVTNTYNTSTNIVNICLNLVLTAVIPLCTGIFLLRKNKLAKEKRI